MCIPYLTFFILFRTSPTKQTTRSATKEKARKKEACLDTLRACKSFAAILIYIILTFLTQGMIRWRRLFRWNQMRQIDSSAMIQTRNVISSPRISTLLYLVSWKTLPCFFTSEYFFFLRLWILYVLTKFFYGREITRNVYMLIAPSQSFFVTIIFLLLINMVPRLQQLKSSPLMPLLKRSKMTSAGLLSPQKDSSTNEACKPRRKRSS